MRPRARHLGQADVEEFQVNVPSQPLTHVSSSNIKKRQKILCCTGVFVHGLSRDYLGSRRVSIFLAGALARCLRCATLLDLSWIYCCESPRSRAIVSG